MWTYVNNEMDESYTGQLPVNPAIDADSLPKTEFDLRQKLAAWHMLGFVPFNSLGWFDKLTDRKAFDDAKVKLKELDDIIKAELKEPVYLAAFQRILSVMPDGVPQKTYLMQNFLNLE